MPSWPHGPCITGNTTSTSPSTRGTSPASVTTSPWPGVSAISVSLVTVGSSPPAPSARCPGSADSSTQRPSVAMPTGTTSYLSGSRAAITLPAEMQEMECSPERPPKTTATRGLRSELVTPRP